MKSIALFFRKFVQLPLTLALMIVTLGLLLPAPTTATETLDQAQTVSQSPTTVSASVPKAQIFTSGYFGRLDQVSLYLENYGASPPVGAVLTVSIQTVIGGLPSGKQIGSGTIPLSAIPDPGSPDWVDVRIAGAFVTAGTQYALVLQTSPWNASVVWWYAYQNAYGSSYIGGAMAHNDGTAWILEDMYDFSFKTYVTPDVLDQEQTRRSIGEVTGSTLGQLFEAGMSGDLDRVSVYVKKTNLPLEVTIQTVTGKGYPSGIVIGQGSIPAGPDYLGWYEAWFTVPISGAVVEAGTQYAIVIRQSSGEFTWMSLAGVPFFYAHMVAMGPKGWEMAVDNNYYGGERYAMFQTYVVPSSVFASPPAPAPPPIITPCSSGVCPAVSGNVTPPNSTARVTSNIRFQALPGGKVHGILNFDDSRTGSFVLHGCTTTSAACRLTVTTFACTDQHAITVAGTYTPKGGASAEYLLTMSGVRSGIGTLTFTTDGYAYTITRQAVVDVTCPPVAE